MGRINLLFTTLALVAGLSRAHNFNANASTTRDISKESKKFTGELWALLLAGSAGWGNYRHQADVYHAYQILKKGGLDDDHIIVFHTDDIASNWMNPHPGKVYNRPGGPDVYEGVPLDYTGEHVTTGNFLAALLGEPGPAVLGTSGKVVKSGPNDRVFVYFADHGAPGILGMPTGDYLYADQLIDTLKKKQKNGGFADLVFYVEACESGSIFDGLLSDDLDIYATTASNAYESSWGTYCPGMVPSPPPELTTCLGDLYSVAFLENCDSKNETIETLLKQYDLVKLRTSNNNTYSQGSHVLQFGDLNIDEEPVADYFSNVAKTQSGVFDASNDFPTKYASGGQQSIDQRQADLVHLRALVNLAKTPEEKAIAEANLDEVVAKRAKVDSDILEATKLLLAEPSIVALLKEGYKQETGSNSLLRLDNVLERKPEAVAQTLVKHPVFRQAGQPVVDDWDCLRAMMSGWSETCGPLDQYGMKHSRLFANLCNIGISAEQMIGSAANACNSHEEILIVS